MGQAPSAILRLDKDLKRHPKRPKSYRFSGIVGDRNHSFGYHLSKNDISGWDYSLQLNRDKDGAREHPNYASAWDLSFNPKDMKLVTNRLLHAAKYHDPRVHGIREFCGTLNGYQTYPWDVHSNSSEGVNSWDSSHLWHVHISMFRDDADAYNSLKGIVDVICGVPLEKSRPRPYKYVPPKFPLKVGQTFGYSKNRQSSSVKQLQQRLQTLGYAPKVSGWADGIYGHETVDSVNKFRKAQKWSQNGKVGLYCWNRLFK